jgi:hypothetical protein
MTPKSAWEDIKEYIPKDTVIWEAFYGNGKSGQYLTELGFNVIHERIDFFQHNEGDIIVSNPPYTKKREVFERLRALDKPFIMLVPTTVLHTLYFKETFGDISENIQLIIPYKKRQFYSENKKLKKGGCSFYTLYICYKIGLSKDVIFI